MHPAVAISKIRRVHNDCPSYGNMLSILKGTGLIDR